MPMRKVLVGVTGAAIVVAVLIVGAVGADFGASIYAEYRLSTTVRKAANLRSDPFVAILRFPFIPQAMREHYAELEIKAFAVEHAGSGTATLEATMHSIDLSYASWLIRPDAKLPVGELESRIIIDSMHLGRYLSISDLMVAAPRQESNDATGGTTESGISGSRGLVFSGTPISANFAHRVSVLVDLSVASDDRATLVITPTAVVTGPDTADQPVPDDKRDAVLHAFASKLPNQKLPFGVVPNTVGARGSDVIIEGITRGVTISLDEFKQS
ncbi:mannan chain length control protein LmeA [Mycobacterium tuberculosis variant bovis]|uniref:mannan chain length control protein LmeA n=1 Tax=Mycobacterium tuberculosis TaxID=1773 RepID=UPI002358D8C3|nr:mannan chain length control protein LmeA [Mycobacterium tuberculosis]WCR82783.1 mannan chain length control protein LmeA [Mycobacterium tuberculosis variant bovis]